MVRVQYPIKYSNEQNKLSNHRLIVQYYFMLVPFSIVFLECYGESPIYTTDTNLAYQWESLYIPPGSTSITFKVKAANDVHIGLSAVDMVLPNFYEIGESHKYLFITIIKDSNLVLAKNENKINKFLTILTSSLHVPDLKIYREEAVGQ